MEYESFRNLYESLSGLDRGFLAYFAIATSAVLIYEGRKMFQGLNESRSDKKNLEEIV